MSEGLQSEATDVRDRVLEALWAAPRDGVEQDDLLDEADTDEDVFIEVCAALVREGIVEEVDCTRMRLTARVLATRICEEVLSLLHQVKAGKADGGQLIERVQALLSDEEPDEG